MCRSVAVTRLQSRHGDGELDLFEPTSWGWGQGQGQDQDRGQGIVLQH